MQNALTFFSSFLTKKMSQPNHQLFRILSEFQETFEITYYDKFIEDDNDSNEITNSTIANINKYKVNDQICEFVTNNAGENFEHFNDDFVFAKVQNKDNNALLTRFDTRMFFLLTRIQDELKTYDNNYDKLISDEKLQKIRHRLHSYLIKVILKMASRWYDVSKKVILCFESDLISIQTIMHQFFQAIEPLMTTLNVSCMIPFNRTIQIQGMEGIEISKENIMGMVELSETLTAVHNIMTGRNLLTLAQTHKHIMFAMNRIVAGILIYAMTDKQSSASVNSRIDQWFSKVFEIKFLHNDSKRYKNLNDKQRGILTFIKDNVGHQNMPLIKIQSQYQKPVCEKLIKSVIDMHNKEINANANDEETEIDIEAKQSISKLFAPRRPNGSKWINEVCSALSFLVWSRDIQSNREHQKYCQNIVNQEFKNKPLLLRLVNNASFQTTDRNIKTNLEDFDKDARTLYQPIFEKINRSNQNQ